MELPLIALCSTPVYKWLTYIMRTASGTSSVHQSNNISPKYTGERHLQITMQVSVEVTKDNEMK